MSLKVNHLFCIMVCTIIALCTSVYGDVEIGRARVDRYLKASSCWSSARYTYETDMKGTLIGSNAANLVTGETTVTVYGEFFREHGTYDWESSQNELKLPFERYTSAGRLYRVNFKRSGGSTWFVYQFIHSEISVELYTNGGWRLYMQVEAESRGAFSCAKVINYITDIVIRNPEA